jgi:phosphoadenosine phosphosulfate reductase
MLVDMFGYKKVQNAIGILKQFEPEDGYYLAFSGGKDSICIYQLAKMAGVKFDSHYNLTTVDPPEVVRFIKTEYPDVEIHRPKESMWE